MMTSSFLVEWRVVAKRGYSPGGRQSFRGRINFFSGLTSAGVSPDTCVISNQELGVSICWIAFPGSNFPALPVSHSAARNAVCNGPLIKFVRPLEPFGTLFEEVGDSE